MLLGLVASPAVVLLTQQIAVFYIALELLGVDVYSTKVCETTIKRFPEDGTFRGQKVFVGDYEDYLARLESRWLEKGILIRWRCIWYDARVGEAGRKFHGI